MSEDIYIYIYIYIHNFNQFFRSDTSDVPDIVVARSTVWVCCRLLAGVADSNPAGACISVSSDCCEVEVSETGRSLVLRCPTECELETSTLRRPWPTRGWRVVKRKKVLDIASFKIPMWNCSLRNNLEKLNIKKVFTKVTTFSDDS
jgi:hypothetical protein